MLDRRFGRAFLIAAMLAASSTMAAEAEPSRANAVNDGAVIIWDGSNDVVISQGGGRGNTLDALALAHVGDLAVSATLLFQGGVAPVTVVRLLLVTNRPADLTAACSVTVAAQPTFCASQSTAAAAIGPAFSQIPNNPANPDDGFIKIDDTTGLFIGSNLDAAHLVTFGKTPLLSFALVPGESPGIWRLALADRVRISDAMQQFGASNLHVGLTSDRPAGISGQIQLASENVPLPNMTLGQTSLVFGAISTGATFTNQTSSQVVHLMQSGLGTVTWTAASNEPWLVVSPTSGTGTATLTVSVKFVPGLAPTQSGSITLTLTGADNSANPMIAVTLTTTSGVAAPLGSFDTPMNGSTGVAGSIAVTGWALHAVQVMRVTICRDPFNENAPANPNCGGNAKIYIGDAVFVDGARPDVEASHPTLPLNSRAGWGYLMLTNFLPASGNGAFTLYAYAFGADGQIAQLGTKTIFCNNASSTAPFGAIDTPAQGAVVTGAVANFGWVLAKSPNFADPLDGGTVNVFVDGTNVGSPGGWTARSDLTGLFAASQYPGISKALGVFGLDTTTLTNGVHTIYWLATGTGGIGTSGIGSRFITASNGAELLTPATATASALAATVIASRSTLDMPAEAAVRIVSGQALASEIAATPFDLSSVQGRRGFDLDLPLRTYMPSSGAIDVQAEELDRIELHLSRTGLHDYTGYLQTPAGPRPLPVGSSLDASTGLFTWMPGVGFYGTYNLTFVRWNGGNAVTRQDVRITLNARGSNRVGSQTIIDAPAAGTTVNSPFFVGGWAADLDATVDSGVNTVHVWAYPIDARGNRLDPIFVGPAIYGGARSDVAAVYGNRFGDSGFGVIVNGLAPGTYDIAVFAYSTVVNNFTPATVVRITVR